MVARLEFKILYARCRGSSVVERMPEEHGVGSSILPLGTVRGKRR